MRSYVLYTLPKNFSRKILALGQCDRCRQRPRSTGHGHRARPDLLRSLAGHHVQCSRRCPPEAHRPTQQEAVISALIMGVQAWCLSIAAPSRTTHLRFTLA